MPPAGLPIHHVGYVVADLRAAVLRFARDHGAGPSFVMQHTSPSTAEA